MKEEQYFKILDESIHYRDWGIIITESERLRSERDSCICWMIEALNQPVNPNGTTVRPKTLFPMTNISWDLVRRCVLIRDDERCRICGGKATEVHHIRPRQFDGSDDPRNLLALCKRCHTDVHLQIEDALLIAFEKAISHGNMIKKGE